MAPKIIIVGAGPSGCYVAQSLRKALPDSELTIMDRLPVPYGLVRYGVAPDHQGTKAVTKQFARLFERQNVNFVGNLSLGDDLALDDLQSIFDIVVMTTGLYQDRSLGDAFQNLENIYGAGQVTRKWNAHPSEADFEPKFGKNTIVIGNGNVAMDIVRLLAKGRGDFDGSDISGELLCDDIEQIHLVGRSSATKAKFESAMVRELAKIENLCVSLGENSDLPIDEDNKNLSALHDLVQQKSETKPIRLTLHFDLPVKAPQLEGSKLSGIVFDHQGQDIEIKCDSAITAIGFDDHDALNRAMLLNEATDLENGHLKDGLFAAGWFRRGPTGTIPENRSDAQKVAAAIISYLDAQSEMATKVGLQALHTRFPNKITTYQDWLNIDAAERARAPEGRVRHKFNTLPDLLMATQNN